MDENFGWWVDTSKFTLSDGMAWLHALPFGRYQHPIHGEMIFDASKLNGLASSVVNRIRGIDPDIDYDHKTDAAKGNMAAGWVKAAQVRGAGSSPDDGLWLGVDFTDTAKGELKEKKYRYFSADFANSWKDPNGVVHKDVLMGGGLTNRPYMKNLLPVNLSELTGKLDQPGRVEDEVDGKKLREALGLAADTTDDAVFAKLGEIAKATTDLETTKTQLTEAQAEIVKLKAPDTTDPELRKLVESSPAVARMYEESQAKDKQLAELAKSLRLGEVNAQLASLQQGDKIALAPVTRDGLREVMLDMTPDAAKKLHEVMVKVMDGTGTVDLSEHGYTGRQRTDDDVDPTKRFNESIQKLMESDKLDYGAAVERVVADNPRLYEEYRNANYTFKA